MDDSQKTVSLNDKHQLTMAAKYQSQAVPHLRELAYAIFPHLC